MITITLEEANDYHSDRLYNSEWENADQDNMEKAISWASRLIDERYDFYLDYSLAENQPVPATIKNAIAELAYYIITKDPTTTKNEEKYSYMKFDSMEVKVNTDYARSITMIPDYIAAMLLPYCRKKRSILSAAGRRLSRC